MFCSVIAIDGPAGVGKTTIAKKLSKKMNAPVLFSGQLYRAVAYEIIRNKVNLSQENKIIQIAKKLDMSTYSSTQRIYVLTVSREDIQSHHSVNISPVTVCCLLVTP